jgi:hypothetical protein
MRTIPLKFFNRNRIILLTVFLVLIGCYFIFIYKPSSPEFRELQRQEKALNLPEPWRRDTSDFGCQWVLLEQETQCVRYISLVYKDTGAENTIKQSLIEHGWLSRKDSAINLNSGDFDKSQTVHFDSWDLYIKQTSTGQLCAVVKLENNKNYKTDGPWAVAVTFFDKTEQCDSHAKR